MYKILIAIVTTAAITACGTNPVTGKKQFTLMSSAQEISLGEKQYSP